MSETPRTNRDFEPIYVNCSLKPASVETEEFLDARLKEMGYRPTRKFRSGVRSLLISLYEAQLITADVYHKVVAIPAGDVPWKDLKDISRSAVRSFRDALKSAGYLELKRRNYRDAWSGESSCDLFDVSLPSLAECCEQASIATNAPNLYAFNKASEKKMRDADLKTINTIICQGKVKIDARVAIEGVSRSYKDFRAKLGGRFQGAYTNISKASRLASMTIDGEPVCEVDISNCNLRLLAAWQHGTLLDGDLYDGLGSSRDVTKAFLVQMIGAGNANRSQISQSTREELTGAGVNVPRDLRPLRDELLNRYPFLSSLQSGQLYSEALAFHESNIVAQTIIRLWEDHQVVSCPMHDCLIVGDSKGEIASEVLKQCFRSYCKEQGWKTDVPFRMSIERRNKSLT